MQLSIQYNYKVNLKIRVKKEKNKLLKLMSGLFDWKNKNFPRIINVGHK